MVVGVGRGGDGRVGAGRVGVGRDRGDRVGMVGWV